MRVLRIEYRNIKLFKDNFIIDFAATDKVVNTNQVYNISNKISLQKVVSIAGINATGKTLALRLIDFVANLINDNTALKNEKIEFSLLREDSEIIVDFITGNTLYRLKSIIGLKKVDEKILNTINTFYYKNEIIYSKSFSSVKRKKDLYMWDDSQIDTERKNLNKNELGLLNDNHSIHIIVTKNSRLNFIPFIDSTNINALVKGMDYSSIFTNLFDDSIYKINYKENDKIDVKFKNDNKVYEIKDFDEQYRLLSSGTIKGTLLLDLISGILKFGGYVVIDEIEVHLNKTLVEFIIDLFMDKDINKKGAVLIFTTHYLEILDSIDRKDAIYISTRDEKHNIIIERFSNKIKRNDVKKSEILLSNYFGNTAPSYALVQKVKKMICEEMK